MPRRFIRRENWEFGGPAPGSEETKEPRSRKRRLASTLVFTTIFFAGASLAAVAGDQLRPLVANDSQELAADSTTTTEAAPTPAETTDASAPAAAPADESTAPDATAPADATSAPADATAAPADSADAPTTDDALSPEHASGAAPLPPLRLSRLPSRTRTHRSRPERRRVPGRRPSCARCFCRS